MSEAWTLAPGTSRGRGGDQGVRLLWESWEGGTGQVHGASLHYYAPFGRGFSRSVALRRRQNTVLRVSQGREGARMEGAREPLPPPSGQEGVKAASREVREEPASAGRSGGGWEEHPRCPHSPSARSRGARTHGLTDSRAACAAGGSWHPAPTASSSLPLPVAPRPVPSRPMAPPEARNPGGAG